MKTKNNIVKISFRDKTYGWNHYHIKIEYIDGTIDRIPSNKNIFMKVFLKDLVLRPSCYHCKAKGVNNQSDITLGDFWGIQKVLSQFSDDTGVSLVILNNQKGKAFFDSLLSHFSFVQSKYSDAVKFNPALEKSAVCHIDRSQVFEKLNDETLHYIEKQYANQKLSKIKTSFVYRVVRKGYRIFTRCFTHIFTTSPSQKIDSFKESNTFAVKNLDTQEIAKSSSGGVFSVLARSILQQHGVVFGVQLSSELYVEHICIQDEQDLEKLRGSKYVQSDMHSCYAKAKEFLQDNRKVLFSGTACQILGLKKFLGKDYPHLFTVDVVCHGVPSPKVFKKYIEEKSAHLY